jgi:hypothetical protein
MKLDDQRWAELEGGYRTQYDPRKALRALEYGKDDSPAWSELWNELHHQGDVGDASYAALPHLVRIYIARGVSDWNTYAIAATIDLARRRNQNPNVPAYLLDEYNQALHELAEHGLREIKGASDPNLIRSAIAVLAIWKQQFLLAELAANFDEAELKEIFWPQAVSKP